MSITGYAGMLNIKQLTPQLIPPAEIFAGIAAPFIIRLTNGKRRVPSFLLKLESSSGTTNIIPFIGQQQTAEAEISLTFTGRGRQPLPTITISSPFPVNFFTRFWRFELQETALVFPRLMALDSTDSAATERKGWHRQQSLRGIDGELERIIPYSGREPLKAIHWKHSARGDELLVKEFGTLGSPPLMIRLHELPGLNLEQQISHAAWLVRRYSPERPVGLAYGDKTIAAAAGKTHRHRLLTELALYGLD